MSNTLREQMLASATDAVNALCTFAQDQQLADFDAREEHVLQVGRALQATWLGQVAAAAGPRTPTLPQVRRPLNKRRATSTEAAHGEQSLWHRAHSARSAHLPRL